MTGESSSNVAVWKQLRLVLRAAGVSGFKGCNRFNIIIIDISDLKKSRKCTNVKQKETER